MIIWHDEHGVGGTWVSVSIWIRMMMLPSTHDGGKNGATKFRPAAYSAQTKFVDRLLTMKADVAAK